MEGDPESHVNVNCGPLGVTMSIIKVCHPATDTSITHQGAIPIGRHQHKLGSDWPAVSTNEVAGTDEGERDG